MVAQTTERQPPLKPPEPATAFDEAPPGGDHLTDYDRAHLKLYARLLDAERAGASVEEQVRVLFGLDFKADEARARSVHAAHLARAKWFTEQGYRDLIG